MSYDWVYRFALMVGACHLLHLGYQFVNSMRQMYKRLHVGNLRADMKMEAKEINLGQTIA